MRKISTKIGVAALAAVLSAGFTFAISPANAGGPPKSKIGLAQLQAPASGDWLIHHYDNRSGQFAGAAVFDDSAEVEFDGNIGGIGRATVKQSAAWTWTIFGDVSHCAQVYDDSVTLVTIHTHAGHTTTAGGTTGADEVSPPLDADDLVEVRDIEPDHPFTATVTITDADGNTIDGAVLGGTNCEVELIASAGHGIYDTAHDDTVNTVTTVFDITGGSDDFADASGDGVLVFSYDTFEPHNLRGASISLNLELP